MNRRIIDGKPYRLEAEHSSKTVAKERAAIKRKQGKSVRVLKSSHGTYLIYTKSK